MKDWAKSDCRFRILVKNYIRKVTSDLSDVTDVSDVTCVTDVTKWMLQDVKDVTDVTCETSEDTFPIQFFTRWAAATLDRGPPGRKYGGCAAPGWSQAAILGTLDAHALRCAQWCAPRGCEQLVPGARGSRSR